MKKLKLLTVFITTAVFSLSISAFEVTGESFQLEGKVTSISLDEKGGIINVSAEAGRYGKVFLTYNVVVNQALPNQGYFQGRGVGINDAGERNTGSRQGVWRREGTIMKFYSLDDVSDANMNYCESVIDLRTETIKMTFYPF